MNHIHFISCNFNMQYNQACHFLDSCSEIICCLCLFSTNYIRNCSRNKWNYLILLATFSTWLKQKIVLSLWNKIICLWDYVFYNITRHRKFQFSIQLDLQSKKLKMTNKSKQQITQQIIHGFYLNAHLVQLSQVYLKSTFKNKSFV